MGALAVFPIAAAIAVLCRKKFEDTVFPAIGLIIVTLMITGMIGSLKVGVFIIPVYVVMSVVVLVLRKKYLKKVVLTPGLLAYSVIFVFFVLFSYGRCFVANEAMFKYGAVVRRIYDVGAIRNDTLYYNLYYPFPFATLWAYFCTFTWDGFSESVCLFANNIFIVSALMPLFRYAGSEKDKAVSWRWLVVMAFVILLPAIKIPEIYSSFDMSVPQAAALVYSFLMIEQTISIKASGKSLIFYSFFATYGLFAACTLTEYGVLAALPLMMGTCAVGFTISDKRLYLLSAVVVGCLATFFCSIFIYAQKEIFMDGVLLVPEVLLGAILLSLLLSFIVARFFKGYHKTSLLFSFLLCLGIGVSTIFILQRSVNSEYIIDWIMEYTDKLFVGRNEESYYVIGKRVIPIYDMTFLFILMAVSGLACNRMIKKSKGNEASVVYSFNLSFITGVVLYLIILSILYVNDIRKPHASEKPIIAFYIAPVMILTVAVVFTQSLKAWKKEWTLLVGTLVLVACVYSDPVGAIFNKQVREDAYPLIEACKTSELLELNGDDRVFYVDKMMTDELPAEFSWAVFPAGADSINGLYFNPEPSKWVDYIKEPLSVEDFANMLKEGHYTYVYLRNIDDSFKDMYYPDFANADADIKSDAIYRVEYSDRGVQIVYIAGIAEEEDGE